MKAAVAEPYCPKAGWANEWTADPIPPNAKDNQEGDESVTIITPIRTKTAPSLDTISFERKAVLKVHPVRTANVSWSNAQNYQARDIYKRLSDL